MKHILLVSYTLYPPEEDYEKLVARLEQADSYELDETAWLIHTAETAAYWYQQLSKFLFEDDEMTILRIAIEDIASDPGSSEALKIWLEERAAFHNG